MEKMAANTGDTALVATLTTSPWWVDYLSQFNLILTSLTLTAGLVLGLIRLWFEFKKIVRSNGDA